MNNESQKRLTISQELCDYIAELGSKSTKSFIVYGSTILGTAKTSSDIDIMVLVDYNDRQVQSSLRAKLLEYEKSSGIHITININLVSEFLKQITEGNHYYLHIALKGRCLLESTVFEGFQSITSINALPSKEALIQKNADDTNKRVQQLFLGSLVKLCTGIRITLLKYLDLKLLEEMELSSWSEYQKEIQRKAYEPSIRKYLPKYADNVIAFFKLSDEVKPMGFNLEILDSLPKCNFIELLECIDFVNKESHSVLSE